MSGPGRSGGEYALWQALQHYLTGQLIHWGVAEGWFDGLAESQPCSADFLASRVGAPGRLVEEWLQCLRAADLVMGPASSFALDPLVAEALVGTRSSPSLARLFAASPSAYDHAIRRVRDLTDADRQPRPRTTEEGLRGVSERLGYGAAGDIIEILPSVPGAYGALRRGSLVVDVGCGNGANLIPLARHFGKSRLLGIDPDPAAISRCRRAIAEAGVTNCEVRVADANDLPETVKDDRYSGDRQGRPIVVLSTYVLHDVTDPVALARQVTKALARTRGTWLVTELDSDEMPDHPFLGLFHAWSFLECVPAGLGVGDGAGLGLLGCTASYMEWLARQVGLGPPTKLKVIGSPRGSYVFSAP